jgi:SAM-dependent methyltransferase
MKIIILWSIRVIALLKCDREVKFKASNAWYREYLYCNSCGSVPRERALALVLEQSLPNWRNLFIHESSPVSRGISPKLKCKCKNYIETQFFPGKPLGLTINGFRNENLQKLTFDDNSFDLFVCLDVLEHVNHPDKVFKELYRTIKPGGTVMFTVPTYKGLAESKRRALYIDDGTVDFLGFEPEYHGNPINSNGSLVTFHYGYDLPDLIKLWCGLDTTVYRFNDYFHGIVGEFTEVYICKKSYI